MSSPMYLFDSSWFSRGQAFLDMCVLGTGRNIGLCQVGVIMTHVVRDKPHPNSES